MTRTKTQPSSTDHDSNATDTDTDTDGTVGRASKDRTSVRKQGSDSEQGRDGGRDERERGHDQGESLHRGEFSERSDRPRDERIDQNSRHESGPERTGARQNRPDAGSIPAFDVTKMFTSMFELGAGMLRIQQQMFASLLGATNPTGRDTNDQATNGRDTGGRETNIRNTNGRGPNDRDTGDRNSDSRDWDNRDSDDRDRDGRDTRDRETRGRSAKSRITPDLDANESYRDGNDARREGRDAHRHGSHDESVTPDAPGVTHGRV
jgi:hypothetical protein